MQVDALAKLTLSLHVTGVRPDGYHELDALMVTVSEPRDALSFEPADRMSLRVDGPFAAGVPVDATNLVWRAAQADGAFCMNGGAARVRGIGEIIEPVVVPPSNVVIATPPFGCTTADVYRAWDELGGPHDAVNDLEPAAHAVEPRMIAFKRTVEDAAGARAVLAGSGSSYAVVFDDSTEAEHARARVARAIDGSVWLGRAPNGT